MSFIQIGDRVRVNWPSNALDGMVGEVAAMPDTFGRFGLRLDMKPRKKPHWYTWVHADFVVRALRTAGEAPRKEEGT